MGPSKLELLRRALAEIGEASAERLAAHLERRHGVKIEARYIPFLRASLIEADIVETVRQTARTLAEQASKDQDKTSKGKTPASAPPV